MVLKDGEDAVIFSYGPVMLNEALMASDLLEKNDISLKVVNMPWLNRVDEEWFAETVESTKSITVIDNHSSFGGLGMYLLNKMAQSETLRTIPFNHFGVDSFPVCGTPKEALKYHRLDAQSLADRLTEVF